VHCAELRLRSRARIFAGRKKRMSAGPCGVTDLPLAAENRPSTAASAEQSLAARFLAAVRSMQPRTPDAIRYTPDAIQHSPGNVGLQRRHRSRRVVRPARRRIGKIAGSIPPQLLDVCQLLLRAIVVPVGGEARLELRLGFVEPAELDQRETLAAKRTCEILRLELVG
jgi:hypothetical protein